MTNSPTSLAYNPSRMCVSAIRSFCPHVLSFLMMLLLGAASRGQGVDVASTVHNLSVTGPGEIRALNEDEICKFCHVPHNAVVPKPLWGHALSEVEQYELPQVSRKGGRMPLASQPDGSSRLCLSCHDGTVALGDIAGEPREVRMTGPQRLGSGRRGFLGTDLSGDHPISFVVSDGDSEDLPAQVDMGVKPLAAINQDLHVRLDRQGKMQCTTCHDPHSDQHYRPGIVPRFWVKPSYEEVCLTCHSVR